MCDFLETNLVEVNRWLRHDAYDWTGFFEAALLLENGPGATTRAS